MRLGAFSARMQAGHRVNIAAVNRLHGSTELKLQQRRWHAHLCQGWQGIRLVAVCKRTGLSPSIALLLTRGTMMLLPASVRMVQPCMAHVISGATGGRLLFADSDLWDMIQSRRLQQSGSVLHLHAVHAPKQSLCITACWAWTA
jgi:hypothetical protein